MLRIGETIDRYRIEALIGQGGMAAVYRARHVQLDSEHAIKVLFITAPLIRDRLIKEGRVQANLKHPNIVSVTDVLEIQGAPALVMEYIDGPALDTWLLENRPTLDEGLYLFRGILRGIAAAHERGVIHRDLKPANVLLAPSSEGFVPKVTDFGLVKQVVSDPTRGGRAHTQAGMALGTPEYMSPEQIRDASDVDTRADLWALGCMLYELVCHRRAFSGPDKMSTFNLIVAGTYEPPRKFVDDLPRNVTEAIRQLLEVDPEKRLARCEDLHALLYDDHQPRAGRLMVPQRPISPLLVDKTIPPVEPSIKRTQPAVAATVPTGVPAARRAIAPTGLREELPAVRNPAAAELTVESEPTIVRRPSTGTILIALGFVLGAVVLAVALLSGPPPRPVEADAPSLNETLVGSPTVAPSPVPVVVAPAPVEPAPPVEPRPGPGKAPPEPRPEAPRPEVVPASGGTATVHKQGDAEAVWLMAGDQKVEVGEGQQVRPGTYQILADFGGEQPVGAGRVSVAAGATITLNCSSFLLQCRAL